MKAAVVLVIVLQASSSKAELFPPSRLDAVATLAAQLNPRGLAADIRVRYRRRLFSSTSRLLEQNFIGAVAGTAVGAGVLRPIVGLELQPLSVLSLSIAYAPMLYLGVLGLAQSYPSPHSPHDSGVLSPPRDGPGGSYRVFVHQLVLGMTLQAKFGRVVARSASRLTFVDADLQGDDRVLYDPSADVPVSRHGWFAQNDTDLGFVVSPRLTVAARHTLVLAWYPNSAYAPGESRDNPNTPTSRLGPVVSYQLQAPRHGAIESATVAVFSQWYLRHRYRTGDAVSGAIPLVGVALVVTGSWP